MRLSQLRRPDLRIRSQLTASVSLFTIVCVISLSVAIYILSRNTLLNIQKDNLALNAQMLRQECLQEFEDIYQMLLRLSYSSPVQRILQANDTTTMMNAGNILGDSFEPDRIMLLRTYATNGSEILEIHDKSYDESASFPNFLTPLSQTSTSNMTLNTLVNRANNGHYGIFEGPVLVDSANSIYALSLTLPIMSDKVFSLSSIPQLTQSTTMKQSYSSSSQSYNSTRAQLNGIKGYATYVVNCAKIQHALRSYSQGTSDGNGSTQVGASALCVAENNLTDFKQLIPFNEVSDTSSNGNSTDGPHDNQVTLGFVRARLTNNLPYLSRDYAHGKVYDSNTSFPIPRDMVASNGSVYNNKTVGVNEGPDKSMIAITKFEKLSSVYYIVVLQSHNNVFGILHSLGDIIAIASVLIGVGMIGITFLFVSFGIRQISRLKMAATYETPKSIKWKFITIPWWLKSPKRTKHDTIEEKGDFQVPSQVPLRKHVRDELDDITERFNTMSNELDKQYQELENRVNSRKAEIEQAKEAADIANAAKSHFLARVTHELRNPLNGIIGTASTCLDLEDISDIQRNLKIIFKCGELLLNLMTDLLSFSKNEVENLTLEMRDFNLPEITSQLKAIFTEQCASKKIKLCVNSCHDLQNLVFSGDTNRISQVIFNLMSNGIKFTPEGGEVYFNADVKDIEDEPHMKKLSFYVRDNGPGIAPEMQIRVFEAFVQGDISNQIKKAGVGLGLSICRQLAERMNGTITLKSQLGHGSTFIFEIPLSFRLADENSPMSSAMDTSSSSFIGPSQEFKGYTPVNSERKKSEYSILTDSGSALTNRSSPTAEKANEKSTENVAAPPPKRSVLTRTLSSTSQITKGFLSSRRRTQESLFRSKDLSTPTDEEDNRIGDSLFEDNVVVSQRRRDISPRVGTMPNKSESDISSHEPRNRRASGSRGFFSFKEKPKLLRTSSEVPPDSGSDSPISVKGSPSSPSPTSSYQPRRSNDFGSTSPGGFFRNTFGKEDRGEIPPPVPKIENKVAPESKPQTKPAANSKPAPESKPETASKSETAPASGAPASGTPAGGAGGAPADASADTSKFKMALPDAHNVAVVPDIPRPSLVPKKSFVEQLPKDIKVLVVDDNFVNQEVIARMLKLEGLASTEVANDGEQAVEKVRKSIEDNDVFDVIFMDVQMPKMDGRQATRVIRQELKLSIPVVAVSAFANQENKDDCFEAGMNEFLSKPVRRPELRNLLFRISQKDDSSASSS